MARYNLFGQIHKALRSMLYDMSLTLQQTNFTNIEDAETSLDKLQRVLDVFDKHTENEDSFILPAIQQYEPSLADAFFQMHSDDREMAEKISRSVNEFYKAGKDEERLNSAALIKKTFTEFMESNVQNMNSEESVLNKVLWKYYSDSEIMILNHRASKSPIQEETSFRNWVVRGLSNAEIVGLMKAVGKNAPDFVFNSLLAIAEKELPGFRYNQVIEGLSKEALVA
ncbi:MAG: hemerythrin domain-containing protein [Bacteroidota bacterium]